MTRASSRGVRIQSKSLTVCSWALGEEYRIELPEPARDRVGWPVPYYLQLIFHKLRDVEGTPTITEADVDQAIERLLDPAHRNYFDYWRQRLHDELGRPDSNYAIAMLTAVCRNPSGASRETLSQTLALQIADADARADKLRYLLDVLQGDGYLVDTKAAGGSVSRCCASFWLRRVAA